MQTFWIAALASLLAACNGAMPASPDTSGEGELTVSDGPGEEPPHRVPGGVAIASTAELAGEYRVAGIDDDALDLPFAMVVSITESEIEQPGPCGGYGWSYSLKQGVFQKVSIREPDPACLARSRIHFAVFATAEAIDAASYAERTPANGIRFSGGGRSVTLFSQ